MSNRLPRVTAKEMIRVLEKIGFILARQSGSHKIYKNAEGRRVTVSYHGATILKPKTLKSILNEANLTVENLIDLLND
ncbi:MAG: type II toxin-antitoxin system HicA family toxin [Coleofasciculaceae cyanobacterium SM2_1_6]|nr:type II toxin-antitoxin system HicA family toxin [Coleofasciculaceae cyanobacterium SM2_1_6]